VARETRELCMEHRIDPLKLIGSGALLFAVERGKESEVTQALSSICRISTIGTFTGAGKVLVRKNGRKIAIRGAPEDELWRVLARTPGRSHRP
jgi:hydrogenase maturation factor